ncbi:MAG: aldo/keto reductase [Silanimonas sp.]
MPSPPLILGSMRFGDWGARLSPDAVADLLAAALDLGIDTLDLADIYGGHTTNALIGAALAMRPGLRERLTLVAKAGIVMPDSPGNERRVQYYDASPAHLGRALEQTLRDLGTDHVEVFLLHRPDPLMDVDAVTAWVQSEQSRGRISAFGLSNVDAQGLAAFDGRLLVVANQIELSLTQSQALDDGTAAATRARKAELQAWSPLGGGSVLARRDDALAHALDAMAHEFGLDRAGLLLRWVASVPGTRVVLGTAKTDRLPHAVQAVSEPLPRNAWYGLWQAARGRAVP